MKTTKNLQKSKKLRKSKKNRKAKKYRRNTCKKCNKMKKNKQRGGKWATKRKSSEISKSIEEILGDNKYQLLLDVIGNDYFLTIFAGFLSPGVEFPYENADGNKLYQDREFALAASDSSKVEHDYIDGEGSRIGKRPEGEGGLHFDGAHWSCLRYNPYITKKGEEKLQLEKHESYGKKFQIKGTNNYCQSFAAFLWASKDSDTNDKHKVTLVAEDYIGNTKKISCLWYKLFNEIKNDNTYYPFYASQLESTVDTDIYQDLIKNGWTPEQIFDYIIDVILKELCTSDHEAHILATAKQ